jgi:GNAT superfamily N-acetyltransferase
MSIDIREELIGPESLARHAEISIAFRVEKVLVPEARGLAGIALKERPIKDAYLKDYDERERPTHWPQRFDMANWGMIGAEDHGVRVGGAVIAFRTEYIFMLDGRSDLAVVWDLRIRPSSRRTHVGSLLFRSAEEWAIAHGCRQLKVETQNVNVAACHFYARMGCTLGGINRYAYRDYPDETQLLWFKEL